MCEAVGIHIEPEPIPHCGLRLCDVRKLSWSRSTGKGQIWFFFYDTDYMGVLPFYDNTWRLRIFEYDEDVPDRAPTLEEIQTSARRIPGDPTLSLGNPVGGQGMNTGIQDGFSLA